jgi:branched-chain amino acid transport system permease protein
MAFEMIPRLIVDILGPFAFLSVVNLSLNLEVGYTGIPNFGKVLSVACGAYTVALLTGRLYQWILGLPLSLDYLSNNITLVSKINSELQHNIPISILVMVISLIAAMLVGSAVGFLSTYPAIRLRSDYLSITLLSLGELQRIIGENYYPIAAGTIGVSVPDPFAAFGSMRFTVSTIVFLLILVIVFAYVNSIGKAPLGRTLKAIRDNELAAEVSGKDTARCRMKVLIIGSALGALGGAMYSFYTNSVVATTFTRTEWTIFPWFAMIVGGMGNAKGSLIGTFMLVVGRLLLTIGSSYLTFLPFSPAWLDYPFFGILIIIVILYRPKGTVSEKPSIRI